MASGPTIKIRRSAVKDKVPSVSDLALGELAINTYDGKIFLKSSQTVGQTTTESIITLEKQLTAGTGVTITSGAINIGQIVSTTATPTFAGATLNGITAIKESGTGAQNTLTVAGAGTGSLFAVGVSNTATDGIKLQSLTSDLANPAKLTISGSPIILKAGTKEITFNDTGNIELPGNIKLPVGGDIVDSENNSVLKNPTVKKITFDNPLTYAYGTLFFTNATATNSANNYITVDDSTIFTVNSPVIFYGLSSFGNIRKSLQWPDITTYFVKSIPDNTTITISETFDIETNTIGPIFNVTTDTGKMTISTLITPLLKTVDKFQESNNKIILLEGTVGLNIGDPIMFSCNPEHDKDGIPIISYGNVEMYGIYYIRSIPDENSITITDRVGSNVDILLSNLTVINGILLAVLSPSSYQIQRAPRLFTPFDSLETTGYDLSSMTYGDFKYENSRLYVMVDLGYGSPQPMDLTPPVPGV